MVKFTGGQMGRPLVTEQENRTWCQRIGKEQVVNAKVVPGGFQIRSAIKVAEVPKDFKVQSCKPEYSTSGGLVEGDKDFSEFRRCLNERSAGPRELRGYPETMQQMHGWLLAKTLGSGKPVGEAERLRQQPLAVGHGWLQKPSPEDAMSKSAGAPAVGSSQPPPAEGEAREFLEAASVVSAAPPSCLSAAGARISTLSAEPPRSTLSATVPAPRSRLSAAPPAPVTEISACSSLPALRLGGDAEALLRRREHKLGVMMDKSRIFSNHGSIGEMYNKGRKATDATYFQEHFVINNGGQPPHKVRGCRERLQRD